MRRFNDLDKIKVLMVTVVALQLAQLVVWGVFIYLLIRMQ